MFLTALKVGGSSLPCQVIQIAKSHASCPIRFEQPTKFPGPSSYFSCSLFYFLTFSVCRSIDWRTTVPFDSRYDAWWIAEGLCSCNVMFIETCTVIFNFWTRFTNKYLGQFDEIFRSLLNLRRVNWGNWDIGATWTFICFSSLNGSTLVNYLAA